jgi:phasin family protein
MPALETVAETAAPVQPPAEEAAPSAALLPVPAAALPAPAPALAALPGPAVPAARPAPEPIGPRNMEKIMKNAEEFLSFSQGNMEALMKAGQIWATGLQDLSKQMAASAQSSLDETVSAFKAMTTAKSLKEAIDLQSSLARTAMEKTMTGSGQLADASFKLAEQALAPLTARFHLAAQRFGAPAGAKRPPPPQGLGRKVPPF